MEENVFSIIKKGRVQLATLSLRFDPDVIGYFSNKDLKTYNLLPILKI